MRWHVMLVAAVMLAIAGTASAQYSERTKKLCFELNYAQRESLADSGDKDAIYCSAVWNAASYTDETMSQAERRKRREIAMRRYEEARRLGFDFNRVAMFGMTFDQLIADGDRLAGNGGVRPARPDPQGDYNACAARIGVACMGQCGGNTLCAAQCNSGSVWQCRR